MPIRRHLDSNFFRRWTPENAYVFGLLISDGTLTTNRRGVRYIEFVSTDRELVDRVKVWLQADHKISIKRRPPGLSWKPLYRIQIANKTLIADLIRMGMCHRNKTTLTLPTVPAKYRPHFIRGFFDGDGCVKKGWYVSRERKCLRPYTTVSFTAKSGTFLRALLQCLREDAMVLGGSLYMGTRYCRLSFSHRDGKKLFRYLYGCGLRKEFYLGRKYDVFRTLSVTKSDKSFSGR